MTTSLRIFTTIIRRDLALSFRRGGGVGPLLAFFVIAASLFPLGIGPDPDMLGRIAPGVIWVCALLASMLGVARIFEEDYDDGSLAQLLLQQTLPEVVVAAKILAHFLATGLPLMLVSPLLALLLHVPGEQLVPLIITLGIGTPSLSLIGALGAVLTLGIRRGGGLVGLLMLPLCVPVLIFGVGAVVNADSFVSTLGLMVGVLLLLLPVTIAACTAGVKAAAE